MQHKPAAQATSDLTGRTVGRFAIRARLGAGGMGEVYLADDTGLKRQVALKRIAPALSADASSRQLLWKEAERASRLNDPHIAAVYDVIEESGEVFLVMEYIEGETLRSRLQRPISISEFLPIATQCACALAAAHKAGLLHRDIKPENIMLTPAGQAKALDFGVAREQFGPGGVTTRRSIESASFSGTLAYMAPEVLEEKRSDARADIFSLGVVFYEMLTGTNPFRRAGFLQTCNAILHEIPPRLCELYPHIPEELDHIIEKLLAKDPEERCATAADLVVDLRALTQRYSASYGLSSDRSRPNRTKFLLAVALLTVLIIALAGGFWVRKERKNAAEASVKTRERRVHSITILPFRKIAGPGEYDYFGTGLADILSAKLTNSRVLEVHSPEAKWNPADPTFDVLEVGKQSKVDAILSGSYQIEGASLSVSYTLLDVHDNVQIAGDAFTKSLTETIEVEHLLASEIVDSLQAFTNQEERIRFTTPPTQKTGAFEAYLRSSYEMERFWREPSADQLARAERPLQEALRLDPGFTLALVSLSRLHWTAAFWGYAKGPQIIEEAGEEANRAIQQDPSLGDAYAARALVEFQLGKLDDAEVSLRTGFSRAPNSALAHYAAGFYYLGRGLSDKSIRAFRRAQELDPQLVRRELTFAYRYSADFDQAEEQARQDLAQHPQDVANEVALVRALAMRGKLVEARKYESDVLGRAPADPQVHYVVSLVRVLEGVPVSIDDWLNRYRNIYWSDAGYCANVAEVLAVSKQKQEALRWLRRSGDLGMKNYPFLTQNPLYENLRGDPDFQSYLKSVRLEWEAAKQREEEEPLLPAAKT